MKLVFLTMMGFLVINVQVHVFCLKFHFNILENKGKVKHFLKLGTALLCEKMKNYYRPFIQI